MKKAHVGLTLEALFEETGEIEEVRALAAKKMIVDAVLGRDERTQAQRFRTQQAHVD